MKRISLLVLACGMAAGFYTPASAQPLINCNSPQNATTYYCTHRDEFMGPPPVMVAPAPYGNVVVAPPMMEGPEATGSIMVAPAPAPGKPMIDCSAPTGALTDYCNNRDLYDR